DLGQLNEAVECFRQTLRFNPRFVEALINLGVALMNQGQRVEAAEHFEEALRLKPDHVVARWNRCLLRLLHGDLERGWPDYEYRCTVLDVPPRPFTQPRWD